MHPFFRSLFILAALVFLSGCMSLGLNLWHKTPRHAAKLPRFSVRDSLLGGNNKMRQAFDVHHYNINLELKPGTKEICGEVTTSFHFLDPSQNTIQLDLDPLLKIDSVTGREGLLTCERKESAVFITLKSTQPNQFVTVYYHGVPKEAKRPPWEGGLVWKKTASGAEFCGVSCEGDGAQLWLPLKAWLGDEPDSADMRFTVPAHLLVVSNGKLIEEKAIDSSRHQMHWKTRYPINVYNITFYLSNYRFFEQGFLSRSGDSISQQFYVLPENFEKAQAHFAQVDSVFTVFEERFGPYPWQNEGYKLVESPYAGMEHQTAIAYGSGYRRAGPLKDYIIVHETAHEWWGNALSVADFRDVWLHEGFATYAEALFVEKYQNYTAYLGYMWMHYLPILNKKPVRGPQGVYYWNYKDPDLYLKGAATLHALRTQLQNDSLFFDILSSFYRGNIGKIVSSEQFIALVNQKSGKDMQPLFTQFLDTRASIKLVYKVRENKKTGRAELVYHAEHLVPNFHPELKIKQGTHVMSILLREQEQVLELPEAKTMAVEMNTEKFYLQVKEK